MADIGFKVYMVSEYDYDTGGNSIVVIAKDELRAKAIAEHYGMIFPKIKVINTEKEGCYSYLHGDGFIFEEGKEAVR